MLIPWSLTSGTYRFGELRRLVARKDFKEVPPRVEYTLTPFGVFLTEALRPLCDWGRRHMNRIAVAKADGDDATAPACRTRPAAAGP